MFLLKKESTRVCTLKALFNFQDTCVIIVLSFEGTFILYHILEILSTPFFEVFSNFFFCDRHSLSTATLISYHISLLLSRPFSKKLFVFLHSLSLSSDSFIIISPFSPFVNSFFRVLPFAQFHAAFLPFYGYSLSHRVTESNGRAMLAPTLGYTVSFLMSNYKFTFAMLSKKLLKPESD